MKDCFALSFWPSAFLGQIITRETSHKSLSTLLVVCVFGSPILCVPFLCMRVFVWVCRVCVFVCLLLLLRSLFFLLFILLETCCQDFSALSHFKFA